MLDKCRKETQKATHAHTCAYERNLDVQQISAVFCLQGDITLEILLAIRQSADWI